MPKKTTKRTKDLKNIHGEEKKIKHPIIKVDDEDLPEDVQEALGIKKQSKKKIHEVDYIAELENEGLDEPAGFDDTLDGGLD